MMSKIIKLFKKVSGKELILQWFKAGVLLFAGFEVLLLGFSKKGLEILRLAIQFKTQKKLKRKYSYVLKNNETLNFDSLPKKQSNKVWFCWLQGVDNAPFLVKQCYNSLEKYLTNKEIIVLTSDNISDYVQFPKHIMGKWKKGIITNTHFSDILRIEILINHGGTWIDSTVLCTGKDIPDYIFNSDLFFYQILKPGRDGHSINLSSWFMSSSTNNKILLNTRSLLYEYWKKNNSLVDYFLLHTFIEIVFDKYPEERKKIVKSCNSVPHMLLLDLFEPFDEMRYGVFKQMTNFHKLNYKREKKDFDKKNTYYDLVINQGNY